MYYNDTITLIKQTWTVNAAGDSIPAESSRTVFCAVKSVGLKRKVEAEQAGLKIDLKFVLRDEWEYDDEPILQYGETRYNIVNTFVNQDTHEIELDAKRF